MRKITIEIIDSTANEPVSPDQSISDTGADVSTEGGVKSNKNKRDPKNEIFKNFLKRIPEQTLYLAERGANMYASMEDDYVGQTNVANANMIINSAQNLIGTTVSMAKVGNLVGGPVGALVGGTVGAMGSAIGIGLKANASVISQYQQLDAIAYSQYFSGMRYGLINGGRGTQN